MPCPAPRGAWGATLMLTLALAPAPARADGPSPVPPDRQAMKQALEDSKRAQPRLPLPPLTPEEEQKAKQGDWSVVNNGRMRKFYLPPEFTGSGLSREPDPGMSLGYPFHTMLFWIVSRGNNCTYCMGHQESKLAAAGVSESTIAALDGDWAGFSPAEQAAFGFARKLTFEPHAIKDSDLQALRAHYTDPQILEIATVVGNFNAMNRWTGALRIPQEDHREYLTPSAELDLKRVSLVAPLDVKGTNPAAPAPARLAARPKLESRAEVEAALAAAAQRTPRLPLVDEAQAQAQALRPEGQADAPVTQYERLLARFPQVGKQRIVQHSDAATVGSIDRTLRAQIAWIAARHDRAWYALGQARQRLKALGQTDDQIFALDGDRAGFSPAERAVFALTQKLTVDPALIDDADIAAVRTHFSDKQTAELIWLVTEAAFFDRVTETAALAPEAR